MQQQGISKQGEEGEGREENLLDPNKGNGLDMDDDYSWTQNLKGVSVYVRVIDGKCLSMLLCDSQENHLIKI